MDVSENGLAFLIDWEGFRPYLYDDGGRKGLGNATVAIGILVHLGPYHEDRGVCRECDKWPRQREPKHLWLTPEQGRILLRDKAHGTGIFRGGQDYVGAVDRAFSRGQINQNQFDAMVSYSYNYGSGAVPRVAGLYYAGADMYQVFTDPRYLKPDWAAAGLLRRRKAEYALWIKPMAKEDEPMTPQEREELDKLKLVVLKTRVDLQELANSQDAVTQHNDVQDKKPKISLKGLWFIAGKAWPF